MAKKLVFVALSGGVDSSVAALLLKEAGHDVIGLHMRLWNKVVTNPPRCHQISHPIEDADYAEQTCHILGIPFHVIDLQDEFGQYVIDYFCGEYEKGRTPNPCIACNKYMKFGYLLKYAKSQGADYLATGHYARIEFFDNAYHLLKGIDTCKDQSYMLYTLNQERLSRLLFPLGTYLKEEVRKLAQRMGLPTAKKPSSQDICFIPADYGTFLSQCFTITPGEIVNSQGKVLGNHRGTSFYTIGQRHRLGLANNPRLYVTKIDTLRNRIVVGTEEELCSHKVVLSEVNWVLGKQPAEPITATVKIRYKSSEARAMVFLDEKTVKVRFYHAQRAVAPGQAAVFYKDGEVMGGGTIEE